MNADEQAVAAVLAQYQDALNQSDTNAVMKLYVSDGVFMPQHFPSSVGADAVRKAYDSVFTAMRTKEPNDDHDESSSDSRNGWAGGSQN
jgi:uncharacterized protein (TIGR02246 family)